MSALPTADPLAGAGFTINEDKDDQPADQSDTGSDSSSESSSESSGSSDDEMSDTDTEVRVGGDKRKRGKKNSKSKQTKRRKTGTSTQMSAPSKGGKKTKTVTTTSATSTASETVLTPADASSSTQSNAVRVKTVSQYEKDREANIARNQALLAMLEIKEAAGAVFKPQRPKPRPAKKPTAERTPAGRATRATSRQNRLSGTDHSGVGTDSISVGNGGAPEERLGNDEGGGPGSGGGEIAVDVAAIAETIGDSVPLLDAGTSSNSNLTLSSEPTNLPANVNGPSYLSTLKHGNCQYC
jgi:hypothetical protein